LSRIKSPAVVENGKVRENRGKRNIMGKITKVKRKENFIVGEIGISLNPQQQDGTKGKIGGDREKGDFRRGKYQPGGPARKVMVR